VRGLTPEEYNVVLITYAGDECGPQCVITLSLPCSFTRVAVRLATRGLVTIHDCGFNPDVCHVRITPLGALAKRIHEVLAA
jgi:hypothetical protein